MDKQFKINLLSAIILVGFVFAVFYHYIMGSYLHLGYPLNTFLFDPNDRFMDFFHSYKLIKGLDIYTQTNYLVLYFPFAYILFYLFSLVSNPFVAFGLFTSIFMIFLVFYNFKFLKCENFNLIQNLKNLFIISFLTYPVLFSFDRGNIEIYVFIFMAIFIYLYLKQNYALSCVFLSFAVAMKLFPVVFLILFFSDKKYKEAFFTIFLTIIITLISLFIFKGSLLHQISILMQNLTLYNRYYIIGNFGLAYSSSLYGALKIILSYTNLLNMGIFYFCYLLFAVISAPILLFIAYKENDFWKKVTLLTLIMIIFPQVSADYRLIYIFIPVWLFVNAPIKNRLDLLYTTCFGLLLIPKNYYFFQGTAYSISIILNPLIMIIIIFMIIIQYYKNHKTKKLSIV